MPAMKKPYASTLGCPSEIQRLQQYTIKLMQHQEYPAKPLLEEINQILATFGSPIEMLLKIAKLLGVVFQVDCCCVATVATNDVDQASRSSNLAYWSSENVLLPSKKISFPELLSLPNLDFIGNDSLSPDTKILKETFSEQLLDLSFSPNSALIIQTQFAGKQNGVICLIKKEKHDWSASEKEFLFSTTPSIALAFFQITQAQIIASQKKHLEAGKRHQELLKELTILSRSKLELNQLFDNVITRTVETLEVDRGLVIQIKYTDPFYKVRSKRIPTARATVVAEYIASGEASEEITETSFISKSTLDESFLVSDCALCRKIFVEAGNPIIIDDNSKTSDNSVISDDASPIFALDKLPSSLLIPIENQGKILGFVVLQQKIGRHWLSAELNLLEMVAAHLSNVIIQTQTLRQVQSLVDDRTAQLQRSLEVQAKLYEKTRQYVEQLRELNQLKDEFLSNLSDRLRYPLTNMRLAITNLRHPGISPERQGKYLDILEQQCNQEINLINDLLTLQKLETHHERPLLANINLNKKIQDITTSFEKKLADNALSISLDLPEKPLPLQTEVESFERILQELLANTCKYSEANTVVELHVSHQVRQLIDEIVIKVTNIGAGISDEESTYIFDKFRRGRGRWTPGTGLGLALVKSLVQHLNGTVSLESIPIEDSDLSKISFTLTLPQFSDNNQISN
jgi:signal transduction histidine kinase